MQGGFQQSMTRREAALILGIREHAKEDLVKDAHRKIMIANHPDAGKASLISEETSSFKSVACRTVVACAAFQGVPFPRYDLLI